MAPLTASIQSSDGFATAIFELVFVLTSENRLVGTVGLLALGIDWLQLLGFCFSPEVSWGRDDSGVLAAIQQGLSFFLVPWSFGFGSVVTVTAIAGLCVMVVCVLLCELHFLGAVSSVRLLLPTRISTTVLSTLLLLPFSITLMMPSQQLMVAVAQTENDAHSFLFRSGTGVVATSTPTIGLLVVSGVVLALFAMIMLVFRLLNTVPDPFDSNDIVRRTSGWVNVAEVAARLALAASGVFLDARTATVILVVVTVVSLLFSLLYPSFINPRLNVFRTGMYGSLCTVACVALYVSIVPQTKATVAYVVLGTMPVVISVFCELCKLRLKRFDAKPFRQLADGPDRVLAMCDGPMDVELASRSCLTAKDRETIEFGARILQAGLKKHHQSSFLHARYALYLEYAYKRHLWATLVAHEVDDDQLEKTDKLYAKVQRQVAAAIRKVFTLQPGFEERFVIFYIDNTQEQTRYAKEAGEAHLDVLQRIQFKRDLRAAKRHHQKSNSLIRAFWRDVSLEVPLIDPWYMIQLASNIQMHVSTGEWHFRRLIMDYPNSDVVLTNFTRFMTNVLNDSRGAQSLEMEVMRIREARAQANLLGIIEDNDPLEGTTSDTNLQSALKANLGRRHQAHDDGSRAKFHTTVHRLRFAVMIVFAVLVIGYLSLYVYTKVTFMHSGIGDISTLEHVLRSTQEITIRARKLELMEVFAVGHTGSSTLQAEIGDWARQMADYVIDVRVSKFALKPTVLEAWRSPTHRIATRAFTGVLADVGSRFTDLESIVSTFSAYSTYLAGQDLSSTLAAVAVPPTTFQPEATSFFSSHPQWAFIADEGLKNMVHNLEHLLETTTAAYNSLLRESQAFFTVCAIVASLVPILFSVFFVGPWMLRQKLERETLVKLFSTIPSDAIVEQQAKMKADSHKQRISETDGSRGDSSSLTTDTNSEQSDDFTTEVAGVGLGATLAARQKTMVPWKRLMLGYSASVLVFLACIATSAGIAIYSCTVDADTGRELHTAGSRVAITLYTYSLAQELIRSDPYIWEGDAGLLDLKERLRANIERSIYIHQSLKHGNASMGLVGLANRYPPQDVLLSDRSCDTSAYNCFSMDELYASFVAKARIVADLSLASLSYDDPAFVDMTLMLEPLVEKLDMSIELIEEEYFPSLASLPLALDVLLALSYPLALAEVLFMLWASRSMINNIDQLRSLLRSLPRSVIAKSPLVDRYLRTGILRTDVQITGKAQKTNNGEDEEDDANLKIRPSNDLKDSALSFNDQPGLFKDGDLPRAAAASLMDTHPGKPSLSGLTTPFIDDGTDADDESHRDTAIESAMYRTRLAGATPPALATDDRRKMLAGSTPAAITSNDRAGYRIGDDTTSSGSNNIYTDADQDFARTLASSKPPSFRLKTLPPHKMALHGSKRSAELDPGELLGVAAEGMVSDKNRGHAKGSRASFSSLGAMTVDSIDGSHRASRESRLGSSSASASSGIDEEKPDDGEEVGGSLYPMTSKVFHERHASSSSSSSGETAAAAHNAAVPPALNKTKMGASSSSSSGILRRSTLDGLTAPSLPERQRSPLRNSNVRFAERDEEIDEYGKRASK